MRPLLSRNFRVLSPSLSLSHSHWPVCSSRQRAACKRKPSSTLARYRSRAHRAGGRVVVPVFSRPWPPSYLLPDSRGGAASHSAATFTAALFLLFFHSWGRELPNPGDSPHASSSLSRDTLRSGALLSHWRAPLRAPIFVRLGMKTPSLGGRVTFKEALAPPSSQKFSSRNHADRCHLICGSALLKKPRLRTGFPDASPRSRCRWWTRASTLPLSRRRRSLRCPGPGCLAEER